MFHTPTLSEKTIQLLQNAMSKSTPIIACSTQSQNVLREYGFVKGQNYDYYIEKRANYKEFYRTVAQALGFQK